MTDKKIYPQKYREKIVKNNEKSVKQRKIIDIITVEIYNIRNDRAKMLNV